MDLKQKRALRSWVIYNTFGDSNLAKTVSGWSDEHILQVFGIDLRNRKSFTRKKLTRSQIKNRKNRYKTFAELKQAGLEAKDAYIYSRNKTPKYYREKLITGKAKGMTDYEKVIFERNKRDKKSRKKEWSAYSKHRKGHPEETFPSVLLNPIEKLNLQEGLDIHSTFGFKIYNFIYVKNLDLDSAMAIFRKDSSSNYGFNYKEDILV